MAKSKKAVTAASISDVQVDVEEVKAPIVEAKAPVVREVIREVVREVPPAHASNLPSTAFLRNETITVKYIMKERSDIKDPKHVGYGGLFVGSSIAIPAPVLDNAKMKNILTNEEKSWSRIFIRKRPFYIWSFFGSKNLLRVEYSQSFFLKKTTG